MYALCLINHEVFALVQDMKRHASCLKVEKFYKIEHKGRVSSLKVSPLLCLQLPLEFTITTFQLSWCAPCLCGIIDVMLHPADAAGGVCVMDTLTSAS